MTAVTWPGGPSLCGPSALGAFATCPQLHAYSQELNLRSLISKKAAEIGTLIHAGLAYYYARDLAPRPSWYVYGDGVEAIKVLGAGRPDYTEIALCVFQDYVKTYAKCTWKAVLVEHQFVVEINSMPYSGRIDLLVQDGPDLVLIDHKTISRITPSIGAGYATNLQMMTGLAQCRAAGYAVNRVVINAMTRAMPNPTFERFDVPINPSAFARLVDDVGYYLNRLKDVRQSHPDPMNRPRNWAACMGKYGLCEFSPLCSNKPGAENEFAVPDQYKNGRQRVGT